jgi:hypothetical protein
MFALCAALVGSEYFQEVQLCFLIVGHMHEDIDQCFSIISNTLKRTNIDSLKELLELMQTGNIIYRSLYECKAFGECLGLEIVHYACICSLEVMQSQE